MANDLNHCSFIGRLGRDPETKYTPSGDAVTNFSIAVGERWKDKASGEDKENTEWVRCVAWRKLGEICGEYLKKGAQVFVSGKMKTRKWEKDGTTHYSTEIIVDQMQMLGSKRDNEEREQRQPNEADKAKRPDSGAGSPKTRPAREKTGGKFDDMEDDIPF